MTVREPSHRQSAAICQACRSVYKTGLREFAGDLLIVKKSVTPNVFPVCPECGGPGKILPLEADLAAEVVGLLSEISKYRSAEQLLGAINIGMRGAESSTEEAADALDAQARDHKRLLRRLRLAKGEVVGLIGAVAAIAQLVWDIGQSSANGQCHRSESVDERPDITFRAWLNDCRVVNESSETKFTFGFGSIGAAPLGKSLVAIAVFVDERDFRETQGLLLQADYIADPTAQHLHFSVPVMREKDGHVRTDKCVVWLGLCTSIPRARGNVNVKDVKDFDLLDQAAWVLADDGRWQMATD